MLTKRHIFNAIAIVLGALCWACQSDIDSPLAPRGGLRVALDNVSTVIVSRSTPAEIGAPKAEWFRVKVEDTGGNVKYDGPYTDQLIPLAGGRYVVTASFGDNPTIGVDAPYYIGTTTVDVAEGEESTADVTCHVGNALISVVCGRDEAERTRFSRFYRDYSISVRLADGSSTVIPSYNTRRSAYFRAGSSVELVFEGTLASGGKHVSTVLDMSPYAEFPAVFKAADHAIVTLTLPAPESSSVVDISKVELEEVTVAQTIPLEWIPAPRAEAQHRYDAGGNLVGTDIRFTDNYPGMTWVAIVRDEEGTVFRTIEGTGSLTSAYDDATHAWPYMPAGNYVATYYVEQAGRMQEISERPFTIGNPDLHLTIGGYTSYDKYLAGAVDEANECNAFTVYAPAAVVNVAPELLANDNYTKSCRLTFDGANLSTTLAGHGLTAPDQTDKTPRFEAYAASASFTFDKVSLTASRDFYITGLPVSFTPPTQGAGWAVKENKVTWNSDNVQLGQMAGAGAHSIEYTRLAIPAGTVVDCPYKVRMHGATVATTLSLKLGDDTYFQERSSSGAFNSKFHDFESNAVFTVSKNATTSLAHSSYGSGQTYSVIYSLTYKYGK